MVGACLLLNNYKILANYYNGWIFYRIFNLTTRVPQVFNGVGAGKITVTHILILFLKVSLFFIIITNYYSCFGEFWVETI